MCVHAFSVARATGLRKEVGPSLEMMTSEQNPKHMTKFPSVQIPKTKDTVL